jgi:hypothetical protein
MLEKINLIKLINEFKVFLYVNKTTDLFYYCWYVDYLI